MATVRETLNMGMPVAIPDALRQLSFGDLLAGLIPRRIARTGLASAATHVEPEAGVILTVSVADGAALSIIEAGSAGAGEALVVYDANGVATITFGDGAQTDYRVVKMVLPSGLSTKLAADNGTGA